MDQTYSQTYKNCAVCSYWGGVRHVDKFSQRVTVASPNVKGKCLLKGGIWSGQEKPASAHCNKWEAWGVLLQ